MKNILFLILCFLCFNCSNKETSENTPVKDKDQSVLVDFMIILVSVGGSFGIMLLYNKLKLRDKIIRTTLESNRVREFVKTVLLEKIVFQNPSNPNSNLSSLSSNPKDLELLVQKVTEAIQKEYPFVFEKKEDGPKNNPGEKPVVELPEVQKKRTQFYSVEPRDGVSFNGSGFSDDFIATESVYFIELQNDNQAHFRIIDDSDTMGRAIKYKKELIDVACESHSGSTGSEKIVTEKPGVALKDGNRWMIKQKAKIKFV